MSAASSLLCCPKLWVQNSSTPIDTQWDRKSSSSHRKSTWSENAQASPLSLSGSYRFEAPYLHQIPYSPPSDVVEAVRESPSIWDDETYSRVTLAKLVKGVYELEHRRMVETSVKKDPPASLWWESVNFELVSLQDEQQQHQDQEQLLLWKKNQNEDKSINLGVYKWSSASSSPRPPQTVVIAIRGTLPRMDDGWHNMHIPLQRLHETPRYKEIMQVVKTAVATHGSQEICIVGHSLGAALGLLVARTLAVEEDIKIESHLFNPVYPYTWFPGPHELIVDEALWSTVRAFRYAAAVGLTHLLVDSETRSSIEEEFLRLREWTPHFYINKGDPICRGYWEYFHNHERLAKQGSLGARVSSLAAPYSTRGLVFRGSKPMHLVPSAVLHTCPGARMDLWTDLSDYRYFHHNLKNWWMKDLQVETRHVRLSSW